MCRRALICLAIVLFLPACAYHIGSGERSLPGGYRQIAIPVFKNLTQQVGVESSFTNAIIREFERSQIAHVVNIGVAQVKLEGEIADLKFVGESPAQEGEISALPTDTAYFTQYRILLTARLRLRRLSDQKVIWEGPFTSERPYKSPRIGSAVVNSANVLYNESARRATISDLATEMMQEAHDRMTENF